MGAKGEMNKKEMKFLQFQLAIDCVQRMDKAYLTKLSTRSDKA